MKGSTREMDSIEKATELMNQMADALNEDLEGEYDYGPDYVLSLDESGLAVFLNADEDDPEYGREAIPDDAGHTEMRLADDESVNDWATY